MGENKSTDYIPENANEEYAVLIGRLRAFEAYANSQSGTFLDKQICLAMLGLNLEEAKEEKEKNEML